MFDGGTPPPHPRDGGTPPPLWLNDNLFMGGGRPDVGLRAATDMEEPCAWSGVREGGSRLRLRNFLFWNGIGLLVENDGVTAVVRCRGPCEGGILSFIRINGEVVDVESCVPRISITVSVDGGRPGG